MKDQQKTFLSAGVTFGIIMGLILGIFNGVYIGILVGAASGVLFGLAISFFLQKQKKKFRRNSSEITKDENIIMDGSANHFKGLEAVGGWLYLTSEEMIFKSHGFNIQTHQKLIPLNKIVQVKVVESTLGFIPNDMKIIVNDGTAEKFVVNNRKNWIQSINSAISMMRK